MSIIDSTMEFCDSVDVSGATGTALVGDVIDLNVAQLGTGYPLYLVIAVEDAFTSGTASTVQFKLASDAAAAIATDGTATEHYVSNDFADSDLTDGSHIVIPLPSGLPDAERYLGLLVVTGAAATTAGTINAYLTLDPPRWKAYPDANN